MKATDALLKTIGIRWMLAGQNRLSRHSLVGTLGNSQTLRIENIFFVCRRLKILWNHDDEKQEISDVSQSMSVQQNVPLAFPSAIRIE